MGSVEAGADFLAASTDEAFANASAVATGWFARAELEPFWPRSTSSAQFARERFPGQRRLPVPASACRIDQPEGAFLGIPAEPFWIGIGWSLRPSISAGFNGVNRREMYTVPGAAFSPSKARIWASSARRRSAGSALASCRRRSSIQSMFSSTGFRARLRPRMPISRSPRCDHGFPIRTVHHRCPRLKCAVPTQ